MSHKTKTRPVEVVDRLSPEDLRDIYIKNYKPVVVRIKSQTTNWACWNTWSPQFFSSKYGDLPMNTLTGIPKHITVPWEHKTDTYGRLNFPLRDAIELVQGNKDIVTYIGQRPVQMFPGLEEDFNLDDVIVSNPEERTTNIWIGSSGTKTAWHYDFYGNVLFQVVGTKRVLLVAPEYSPYMYPYWDSMNKSKVDPYDLSRFPDFANNVVVWEAVLHPGDMLHIPTHWWHYVIGESISISVNVWFDPSTEKDYSLQLFTRWQKVLFGFNFWFQFVKAFLGFPKPRRLFAPYSFGVMEGVQTRQILWGLLTKPVTLLVIAVVIALYLKYRPETLKKLSTRVPYLQKLITN